MGTAGAFYVKEVEKMKVRKLRKKLSNRLRYKVGINGDFIGTFSREDLKEYDELKVVNIWAHPYENHGVMICLDLNDGGESVNV